MDHFYKTTSKHPLKTPLPTQLNVCIMGRKSFESLPRGYLPGRQVFVLTRAGSSKHPPHPLVRFFGSAEALLREISEMSCNRVFICGGQGVYEKFIHLCTYIHLTEVFLEGGGGDTFFPHSLTESFELVDEKPVCLSGGVAYRFTTYRKIHPEWAYLDIAKRMLADGKRKDDRTQTGTIGIFGPQMEFDLRDSFPLLTTKRVFWTGVLKELFWFISGNTDSRILSGEDVKIWEGNTSRAFLDSRGLSYTEGDIGPGYGFQWRHWGTEYGGCEGNYEGRGVDQLSLVIDEIRKNPYGRRHIVSAWNVEALDKMVLPPCHLLFQFYADDETHLDLKMYQRSGDWFLGVPFNIASYGVLLLLAAKLTGRVARKLIMTFGDAHVYSNHIRQLTEQLDRAPLTPPLVEIVDRGQVRWEDFLYSDVHLHSYKPHPGIKAEMAV
jgi:thymidylate synthase/dihydrofolate reductase